MAGMKKQTDQKLNMKGTATESQAINITSQELNIYPLFFFIIRRYNIDK